MNLKLRVILFIVFANSVALAQNQASFELKRLTLAQKYDSVVNRIKQTYPEEPEVLLEMTFTTKLIAEKLGDTLKILQSNRLNAHILTILNRNNEALPILIKCKAMAERHHDREELKKILNLLANVYTFRAEFEKALKYNLQALALREEDRDSIDIANTYNNIALIYYRLEKYDEALTNFLKALEIQKRINDDYLIEVLYSNIGHCYRHINKHETSLSYFTKAMETCRNNCNDFFLVDLNFGLGLTYFYSGKEEIGLNYLTKAYSLSKAIDNRRGIIESAFNLGIIKYEEGDLTKAKRYFTEVISTSKQENFGFFEINAYKHLSKIYKREGNYTKALEALEIYQETKDKAFDDKVLENIAEIKSDYLQRKNLATIQAHASTIAQQKKINLQLIVIVGLCVLVLIVFVVHMMITKRINRELKQAQDLIHDQNRQLEVRNRELDKLVDQKTHELKHVNLTLKKMNDELAVFIDHIAKDICAPLATLKGICNVALIDVKDNVTSNYIKIVDSISEQLHTKLNRLLAINKIHQSRLHASAIDLKTMVDEVIANYWKRGLPKNILLRKTVTNASTLNGDHELLTTILENLIDNAVKTCINSPKENHFIELKVSAEKNGRVRFEVINNGLVMDAFDSESTDLLALDAPFHKLPVSSPNSPDLYVIKSAVKKVGGKLDMNKTPEGYNVLSVVV